MGSCLRGERINDDPLHRYKHPPERRLRGKEPDRQRPSDPRLPPIPRSAHLQIHTPYIIMDYQRNDEKDTNRTHPVNDGDIEPKNQTMPI